MYAPHTHANMHLFIDAHSLPNNILYIHIHHIYVKTWTVSYQVYAGTKLLLK